MPSSCLFETLWMVISRLKCYEYVDTCIHCTTSTSVLLHPVWGPSLWPQHFSPGIAIKGVRISLPWYNQLEGRDYLLSQLFERIKII